VTCGVLVGLEDGVGFWCGVVVGFVFFMVPFDGSVTVDVWSALAISEVPTDANKIAQSTTAPSQACLFIQSFPYWLLFCHPAITYLRVYDLI
jgi:hypothetical protein